VTSPPFSQWFFDCDSTLSRVEGIEELAVDCRGEIERLTREAMEGRIPLEEVYGLRLAKIRPTRADLERLGRRYVAEVVEDAADVIAALQLLDKEVHVVSGGILQAVVALADHLRVPRSRVHAVELYFGADGPFTGFDQESPLARRGGKREIVRGIVRKTERAVFIGDGATDLEALDVVDLFIGYGGVARREEVARRSHVFLTCESLAPVLSLALTDAEKAELRTENHLGPLLDKGVHLVNRGKVQSSCRH